MERSSGQTAAQLSTQTGVPSNPEELDGTTQIVSWWTRLVDGQM